MLKPAGSARVLPLLLLPLAGCATVPPPAPPPPPVLSSEFQIFRGDSLIATEVVTRSPQRLEGSVELIGRARAEYDAELGPGASVSRIEVHVVPWEGAAGRRNEVLLEFVGDSVFLERRVPMRSGQRTGGGPTMPYLHPSPGLLEQLMLRASAMGGAPGQTVDLRVWIATRNTATPARVTFLSRRIADVQLAGAEIRVWMDEFGLLLAEVPSLGWLIQRRQR